MVLLKSTFDGLIVGVERSVGLGVINRPKIVFSTFVYAAQRNNIGIVKL